MTILSEDQRARIDSLAEAYLLYQTHVAEAKARAELRVLRETLAERLTIAREARELWTDGVPARTLGDRVMGTANYANYMKLIEDGERELPVPILLDAYESVSEWVDAALPVPVATFDQEDKDQFKVTLRSWGPTEISGTANFIRVDGEWLNSEVGNEVGEYVERSLFVDGSDEALRGLFDGVVS